MRLALIAFGLLLFPAAGHAQDIRTDPGPMELRAKRVTPENPVPRRTDYRAADYPHEARVHGISAMIVLRVTVDEAGRVGEVRRSGFSIESATPRLNLSFANTTAAQIFNAVERASGPEDAQAVVRALEALTQAAAFAVTQWRYEPPVDGPVVFDVRVNFRTDGETSATIAGPTISSTINTAGAVRVGGGIKAPAKTLDVRPVYPAIAQSARVSGIVIVEARIGVDGSVEALQVLRSIPLLDQAALDAVSQWKFVPTLLNGAPTPVIMTVTVNFTLQ